MRLLLLLGVVVSTASAAMTEQQLVYGLAKLYHKINQLPDANKWVHFTKAIMGWHINEKKRQSTQKERTMEGLYNLERLAKGTLGTMIADNPAYTFVELVDMEPNFGKYFNDTLSNLFFDHLSYVYQQICLMKYKAAKDEVERILISTGVDMNDVPTEPVKGYELMANGFSYFVELSGKTSTFTNEVSRMKEISKLFDTMKNASLALQDEFYKSQRKIVYACLRQPKEGYFDGALHSLLFDFVRDKWMMKALQWCTTPKKSLDAAVAMSRCIANPPSEEELMKHEGEVDDTLFDERDFFQNLAEFSRSFNIYRDASFTEIVRIGVEDLNLINDMKSSDPYDIIREGFTYFFVEINVTSCAVPKLDAMVAKAHQETSTTTKFQGVYDDLMNIFETCWEWPEGLG